MESKLNEGINFYIDKYHKFIDLKFKQFKDKLDFKVDCQTSYHDLLTEEKFNSMDEDDIAETLKEQAHYIGVIINVIKKKAAANNRYSL